MARESRASDSFDLDGLRQLMELMEKHDVREFKVQRGDLRYVLRRGPQEIVTAAPIPMAPLPTASSGAPASSGTPAAPPPAAAVADENLAPIKSPTVGTFYQAPSPGEAPFVRVGDTVKPDTVVCIIEAMKVFNQIPAGIAGTIAKVLVADGDPVEFGQPLFLVKT